MAGPPPPAGFVLDDDEEMKPRRKSSPPPPAGFKLDPTGDVVDGDTLKLRNSPNGRLYGVDAFEKSQPGYVRTGQVSLGDIARQNFDQLVTPASTVNATGTQTYGRPVVTVGNGPDDAGQIMVRRGLALAEPDYLRDDPARLSSYMEAERQARLNRIGAHGGHFQTPSDFRHGVPDPWAQAQPSEKGDAVFFDEPTPFQGLRPEIAQGYIQLAQNPNSSATDLVNYAKANGFLLSQERAEQFIKERSQPGAKVGGEISYEQLPQVLTDQGDGTLGAFGRGVADPINMLDEMGGVIDTLGGTDGRESIWNSDRRFGDILWNNIDQNRSILAYDDAEHPYARFGGQLASGVAIPSLSVEGVGLNAARQVLRSGGTRMAAEAAAKAAVSNRLAAAGAIEGGAAGFGAAEGDPIQRLPGAAIGAVTGAGLGYGTGALAQELLPIAQRAMQRGQREARVIVPQNAEHLNDIPAPPPGFTIDMADETSVASITADAVPDAPRVRPLLADATDAQRQAEAQNIRPGDVLPITSSEVRDLDEAERIGAGMRPEVKAPDERTELSSRGVQAQSGSTLPKRGPLDLVSWLRSQGGIRAQGGELEHMGIDNAPRDFDFAKGEGRFGKLVSNSGLGYDEAAERAWEAGYFPDHAERPTVREFLDALGETHSGRNRSFLSDDLDEIDRFNVARSQRHAVESAQQEGAPLIEDRGQPIGEDDLDRMTPPVAAYEEWPDGGPDLAGNIRLDRLESPQDIKRALSVTDQRVGGFDAARRGRITQAETESLANELGMTPAELLSRRKGQALNAEQALAARQILAKSGNDLVNMARKISQLEDPGDEALAAFRQAWVRHVAIQEQVAGATAEAGRALSQFRMAADSRNVTGNVLHALVQSGGGSDRLKDVAQIIVDSADDPRMLNTMADKAIKPRFRDKLVELWYNSLLSGPQTHVVNVLSNTMTALGQLPEHAIAAGIGAGRAAFTRKASDRVLLSEVGARATGLLQGAREGLAQAARTFRTGEPSDFVTKVEAASQKAIGGKLGEMIRIPTRALSAEDELFKAMARRMELSGLAVRQAAKEGLKGDAARNRISDLIANPSDDMLERAFDYGRYLTFQRPLGPVGSKVSGITQDMPILKLFLPFVRTPTNLLKFSLERSPAAPLLQEWRRDFAAGGARRDLALARAMVGTGVGMAVMELASQGLITGNGPADDGAKNLLRADGWQPYSVKIGDKYVSYQRLDPFSSTFGIAADMVDLQSHMTEKQRDKVAMLVVASVMQNLANKTWLSGLSDAIEALSEPERKAGNLMEKLAGSIAVPAGVAQVARTVDPTLRDAQSILEAVKARVPGYSKTLEPRRDVWGQPITGEGGVGPDIVSPIWQSTRRNDPANNELVEAGAHIGKPSKKIGDREMTPREYGAFQEASGSLGKMWIEDLVRSPEWKTMSGEDRQDAVREIMRKARKMTKAEMFGGDNDNLPPPPPPGFVMAR